jgi:hypothetical protein
MSGGLRILFTFRGQEPWTCRLVYVHAMTAVKPHVALSVVSIGLDVHQATLFSGLDGKQWAFTGKLPVTWTFSHSPVREPRSRSRNRTVIHRRQTSAALLFEVPVVPREPIRMKQEHTSASHGGLARSLISISDLPIRRYWAFCTAAARATQVTSPPHYIHCTQRKL